MDFPPHIIGKKTEICLHIVLLCVLALHQLRVLRSLSERLPVSGGIDLADTQLRDFRRGLPLLSIALLVFVIFSNIVRRCLGPRLLRYYYAAMGSGFVMYAHGGAAFFPICIASAFYAMCCLVKDSSFAWLFVWTYVVCFLFMSDWYSGWYGVQYWCLPSFAVSGHGIYRWHVGWNLASLRLISFGLDWAEASQGKEFSISEKHTRQCLQCSQRLAHEEKGDTSSAEHADTHSNNGTGMCYSVRQNTPRMLDEYSFIGFIAYVFYIPLYIAGPITTFNAFASHVTHRQSTFSLRYIFTYAVRWCICFSLLEWFLRNYFLWSIVKNAHMRSTMNAGEFAVVGFWLLNALWLKFAVIWRFARFWALVDGVEVIENMTRCMNNNYTIQGFWRNWHRSFNRWLVRYMYIPMGGSSRQFVNVFPIFLFVAAWHDLELKLVKWAVLMAIFIVPETIVTQYFQSEQTAAIRSFSGFRYLKACIATLNITILLIANLVGFGIGDHTGSMLDRVFSMWPVIVYGFVEFFSASCLMMEVRDWEALQESRKKLV
ncbi:hypothetical protein DIPPA_70161 [Diplonema papillatum]|nr:hypothetical protein DIPPA_70161 [Diplonema papillatum]